MANTVPVQRRDVLSEEEFASTLSKIIQRDFFPDLQALSTQVALQARRSAGDLEGVVALRKAARREKEKEVFLTRQEAQEEEKASILGARESPRPLSFESLTTFHARATSEDNVEYEVQQQEALKRHRQAWARQHALALNGGKEVKERDTADLPVDSLLSLASDHFDPPSHNLLLTNNEASNDSRNPLFFVPTAQNLSSTEGKAAESQPLLLGDVTEAESVGDELYAAELMPPPRPVEAMRSNCLIEYLPKHAFQEKKIEPAATRFPPLIKLTAAERGVFQGLEGSDASPSADDSSYTTDSTTDLDSVALPISVERRRALKRKRIENQSLVQMTPLIIPGRHGQGASPLVTWGAVSSTPMVLERSHEETTRASIPSPAFRMPSESERDKAAAHAHSLLERRAQRARSASSQRAIQSTNQVKLSSRPPSARSKDSFASALRSSYTPLSQSKLGGVSVGREDTAHQATPLRSHGFTNGMFCRTYGALGGASKSKFLHAVYLLSTLSTCVGPMKNSEHGRRGMSRPAHESSALAVAEKYGLPGLTDPDGFDPYNDTVGPGIYGGSVKRDETGKIIVGPQYQGHNSRRPGPVYDGTGYSLMARAIHAGPDSVRRLLKDFPELRDDLSTGGARPLHICGMSRVGELSTQVFIDAGADLYAVDTYGYTALHRMASNNLALGGEALVKAGMDPRYRTKESEETPIEIAQQSRALDFLMTMQRLGYLD